MAKVTVADRLHAVVAKVAPEQAAEQKATGRWLNRHPTPGHATDPATGAPMFDEHGDPVPNRHSGAPYFITELPDTSRRVSVLADDGSVYVGNGISVESAVADLEVKLGIVVEV